MKFDKARLYRWAKAVKAEKGNVCVRCGSKKNTEVHHIFPKHLYPKMAYLLSNGVVLCKCCHRTNEDSYHSVMGYKGSLKLFKKWLKKTSGKTVEYKISKKEKPTMLRFLITFTLPIHLMITVVGLIVMGKLSHHHIVTFGDYLEVWRSIWHYILVHIELVIKRVDSLVN